MISGCNDQYWRRSDSIYLNHGDAVRSNIAVQVQDPWPKGSDNTNIPMDPVKAQAAIECYRQGAHAGDPLGSASMGFKSTAGGAGGGGGASNIRCAVGDGKEHTTNAAFQKGENNRKLEDYDRMVGQKSIDRQQMERQRHSERQQREMQRKSERKQMEIQERRAIQYQKIQENLRNIVK